MTQTTPTRDEAVRSYPNWPEYLMIRDTGLHDDQGGLGQRIYTTAGAGYKKVRYVREDLASTPAPASGGVDAVWKALDTANRVFHFDLRHMIEWGDDYNQAVKDASDRVAAAIASLSPAATPVSEAGGEAAERSWRRTKFEFIGAMRQALINSGLTREQVIIADNAITEAFSDLAKPASSPAGKPDV